MPSIVELASQMYDAFERDTRDNDETFYKLKDGSPEWMTTVIHAAHGDFLPDDWRYATIQEACSFIVDRGKDADLDDAVCEFADDVDVYHGRLLQWVSSNLRRMAYVDDALEDYGAKTLADALMQGQANERREVFDALVAALGEVELPEEA